MSQSGIGRFSFLREPYNGYEEIGSSPFYLDLMPIPPRHYDASQASQSLFESFENIGKKMRWSVPRLQVRSSRSRDMGPFVKHRHKYVRPELIEYRYLYGSCVAVNHYIVLGSDFIISRQCFIPISLVPSLVWELVRIVGTGGKKGYRTRF